MKRHCWLCRVPWDKDATDVPTFADHPGDFERFWSAWDGYFAARLTTVHIIEARHDRLKALFVLGIAVAAALAFLIIAAVGIVTGDYR